ncbi:hypothetical protein CH254_24135 [Rhodococcus sp. 06-412-2C]|uniref:DUF3237 domain-containing protein n=1 Tax=unclassified Rhodococcus (in: high G+C Gram-positive bacteria) TaxID=192944 RepID=UPI000B9C4949|nr:MULTISPECIES: DUF3237 domain-containing protein [unclassified Rhodococcus (in: high G+C Gram-positive bacteria)]OZC83976.1 hypothetical protein CH254_24135 [Rhodococcus sp. 06-412-2C]OZC94163.1 hypothetical protein CH279_22220 [Rhodococcus sp. 06-412-2B]
MTAPIPPTLTHVLHLEVEVAAGIDLGTTPNGVRRIVPIVGGRVSGPLMTGTVLPGGTNVQQVRSSTTTAVLARYVLESDRGELVMIENRGVRRGSASDVARLNADEPVDPANIYFRSTPVFETGAPRLSSLNDRVHVGAGVRRKGMVIFDVFEVV